MSYNIRYDGYYVAKTDVSDYYLRFYEDSVVISVIAQPIESENPNVTIQWLNTDESYESVVCKGRYTIQEGIENSIQFSIAEDNGVFYYEGKIYSNYLELNSQTSGYQIDRKYYFVEVLELQTQKVIDDSYNLNTEPKTASEHLNYAVQAIKAKDYDLAITELDECLCLCPEPRLSFLAWNNLGFSITEKISLYKRDQERLYPDDWVWVGRALICYQSAVKIFEQSEAIIISQIDYSARAKYDNFYQTCKQQENRLTNIVSIFHSKEILSDSAQTKIDGFTARQKALQTLPIIKCLNEEEKRKMENYRVLTQTSQKKSMCFVATATYGSPFAPEVIMLSNFRDKVLLKSILGKAFVKFYYFVSPPLASMIAKTEFLRAMTRRIFIAPILRLLKAAKFDS